MSDSTQQNDPGTVLQTANRLNVVINALNQQAEELPKRLNPILADEPQSHAACESSADNPAPEAHCPLESTLLQYNARLESVHERLRDIQNRLCI